MLSLVCWHPSGDALANFGHISRTLRYGRKQRYIAVNLYLIHSDIKRYQSKWILSLKKKIFIVWQTIEITTDETQYLSIDQSCKMAKQSWYLIFKQLIEMIFFVPCSFCVMLLTIFLIFRDRTWYYPLDLFFHWIFDDISFKFGWYFIQIISFRHLTNGARSDNSRSFAEIVWIFEASSYFPSISTNP